MQWGTAVFAIDLTHIHRALGDDAYRDNDRPINTTVYCNTSGERETEYNSEIFPRRTDRSNMSTAKGFGDSDVDGTNTWSVCAFPYVFYEPRATTLTCRYRTFVVANGADE